MSKVFTSGNISRFDPTKKTVNERLKDQMEKRDETLLALVHNDEVTRSILGGNFLRRLRWLIQGK